MRGLPERIESQAQGWRRLLALPGTVFYPKQTLEISPGSRAVGRRGLACVERRGQKSWSSENQGIWTGFARKVP